MPLVIMAIASTNAEAKNVAITWGTTTRQLCLMFIDEGRPWGKPSWSEAVLMPRNYPGIPRIMHGTCRTVGHYCQRNQRNQQIAMT